MNNSFKDNRGRTWTLAIDVNVVKQLKQRLDVDVLGMFTDASATLMSDIPLLVDTLWVIVEPQARDKDVSDLDFGGAMVGDAIEHAAEALLGAVASFFPSRRRDLLMKVLAAGKKLDATMLARAEQQIASIPSGSPANSPA